jgi:hypothetical protein
MPKCSCCKRRIDLSHTGIRAYICSKCNRPACRNHFDFSKGICYKCADIQISRGKCSFSFVRKASLETQNSSRSKK